ncbi:hypothetical protein B0H34DRAFT_773588 [Crassisporium funariophilum]|nr:hypothetical protein B0H34DRAFT_773588 [Crassisporium funariophilum]
MHFPASALPPTLLDLTMLRIASTSSARIPGVMGTSIRWKRPSALRRMHQAAPLTPADPGYDQLMEASSLNAQSRGWRKHRGSASGSLSVRSDAVEPSKTLDSFQELERRVQALDDTIGAEELAQDGPFYSEGELTSMYQDVLAIPIPESEPTNQAEIEALKQAEAEEDLDILQILEERLCNPTIEMDSGGLKLDSAARRILVRAHEVVSRVEATRNVVNPDASLNPQNFLPISVLTIRECQALVRVSMKTKDAKAAELALDIMKRTGLPIPDGAVTEILKLYATSGNLAAADNLLANFLTEAPTETQRHLHVQAHLNGTPLSTLPTSALDVLHHYEGQNLPAPMHTYTTVITSLFSRSSSLARAHAWDIFTHMRYAAHPNPDILLYTLMIRACASPISTRYSSEPEKALDLWMEMTVDHKIMPTVGSYNAIILACARSGTKTYVNEAFRLARQMLDSHRDAQGFSAFRPDRKTFCALLEGSKRIGDLSRARWILAEMVRGTGTALGHAGVDAEIDEEVMMHMFHTYAAYRPPFLRAAAVLVKDQGSTGVDSSTVSRDESKVTTATDVLAPHDSNSNPATRLVSTIGEETPSFAHIPPQSRAEVIREVKLLFNRIIEDRGLSTSAATASLPFSEQRFRSVELSTRLVSAYLSVFYNHASLETSRELFWKIFEDLEVARSPRVYLEALERCGNARRGHEREVGLQFAEEVWVKWREMEVAGQHLDEESPKKINPRMVERAHVAMIRVLAITQNTDRAMDHLRSFASQYPANALRNPPPKRAFQSTRTSLVGSRPLVRMTSSAEVPDDHVPPLLTFRDIEVLHHRLIDEERTKDIGYVTWVCKSYEWALRVRRDNAVKAKIPKVGSNNAVVEASVVA